MDRMLSRLQSLCGIGRIAATTALGGKGLHRAQVRFDADEVRDDTPLAGLYGVASRPLPGADAIVIFPTGDRARGVIVATNDRRYQIEMAEGEVVVHDDLGHVIHLTRGGIKISGGGHNLVITGAPKVTVDGDIEATGDIKAGTISLRNHLHTGVQPGSGQSGPPKP